MDIENVEQLLNVLQNNKIVIYGAGYVAMRFYNALKQYKLEDNVECFVTTLGGEKIVDKESLSISGYEYYVDHIVCIAVHESIKDDIIGVLKQKGVCNYVWIYPFLYELLLSGGISKNEAIPMKNIVKKATQYYGMAVRNLVIGQYYGKNEIGYNIYIKAQALHCDKETAKKRLKRFIHLIEDWGKNGYDEKKAIIIQQDNIIIDGAHRAALAAYHQREYIIGKVAIEKEGTYSVHNEASLMEKKFFVNNGFDAWEIKILDRINQELREKYECAMM